MEFGEWTRDCSLGHVGKEGPHLTMMGASREFSRAAVPVWGFHEVGRGAQGASRVAPGKLGFHGRGEGNASLLSSHGRAFFKILLVLCDLVDTNDMLKLPIQGP